MLGMRRVWHSDSMWQVCRLSPESARWSKELLLHSLPLPFPFFWGHLPFLRFLLPSPVWKKYDCKVSFLTPPAPLSPSLHSLAPSITGTAAQNLLRSSKGQQLFIQRSRKHNSVASYGESCIFTWIWGYSLLWVLGVMLCDQPASLLLPFILHINPPLAHFCFGVRDPPVSSSYSLLPVAFGRGCKSHSSL